MVVSSDETPDESVQLQLRALRDELARLTQLEQGLDRHMAEIDTALEQIQVQTTRVLGLAGTVRLNVRHMNLRLEACETWQNRTQPWLSDIERRLSIVEQRSRV